MGFSFVLFMLAMAVLLVIACIVTVRAWWPSRPKEAIRPRSATPGQVQPKKDSILLSLEALADKFADTENRDMLLIQHVPVELSKSKTGFKAAAKVQSELLVAGDAVLRKLPADIRDCLGFLVSCDRADWLSQGDNLENLTPERVRAATAVAEATLALWALMFEFDYRIKPPHPVVLNESAGELTAGKQVFAVRYVISRIRYCTGVNLAAAIAIWQSIIEILRENLVSIPGIRATKMPAETSEKK